MTPVPIIAAFKAIAITLDLPLIIDDAEEICISLGADTTMTVMRADEWDSAPWQLQFEFSVRPENLPTEQTDLAGRLTAALIRVAGVIGRAGAAK